MNGGYCENSVEIRERWKEYRRYEILGTQVWQIQQLVYRK